MTNARKKRIKPLKVANGKDTDKPLIPKDLQDKWGAVEAVATTFNLLQRGSFTRDYLPLVNASCLFLQKLHEQTVGEALKHPQSDLIPELKALKEGKTDGQKATNTGAAQPTVQ